MRVSPESTIPPMLATLTIAAPSLFIRFGSKIVIADKAKTFTSNVFLNSSKLSPVEGNVIPAQLIKAKTSRSAKVRNLFE